MVPIGEKNQNRFVRWSRFDRLPVCAFRNRCCADIGDQFRDFFLLLCQFFIRRLASTAKLRASAFIASFHLITSDDPLVTN